MWDFLSVVKNESVEWVTATKFYSMNDLSHGWGRYQLFGQQQLLAQLVLCFERLDKKWSLWCGLNENYLLTHKWYFKVTKVMKEYAGWCARMVVVFDIEIISFLIPKSISAWKLHDLQFCWVSTLSHHFTHICERVYSVLFNSKIVWNAM